MNFDCIEGLTEKQIYELYEDNCMDNFISVEQWVCRVSSKTYHVRDDGTVTCDMSGSVWVVSYCPTKAPGASCTFKDNFTRTYQFGVVRWQNWDDT